ncbi:MAG: indolepyruvate oxidoreductase subunit beta [Planctomycetota bacterium]|jgi:indolepyruvate ferredoxin oxidoreductase beta subunit|nr:indolepyruvate oxidoreductase subunit beta [Planctomycetota bacterium]
MTTSIILAGVGGQGILLAGTLVARAAMSAGLAVKTNETHGMAQRGGAVTAHVRYGKEVHSPLIPLGTATALAALECLEVLRAGEYLAPDGKVVASTERRIPVNSGAAAYPADIEERVKKLYPAALLFDAVQMAREIGNIRVANVIVVGALAAQLDLPLECWQQALAAGVKPQHLELNQKAFRAGLNAAGAA